MEYTKKEKILESIDSKKDFILCFSSDWCGPCKAMGPMLEQIDTELGGNSVYKVNVDKEPELSQKYGIRSIPTLIFFKDGVETEKIVGATSKKFIMNALNS